MHLACIQFVSVLLVGTIPKKSAQIENFNTSILGLEYMFGFFRRRNQEGEILGIACTNYCNHYAY